eukprot:CAMPEP_0181309542 /NCGR_PEP_ID=MMETSP1101-20121128/12068_1 /TAXON_ID=46948 /ORGANISM="Rhodomonas abbreviata, Strain Caron Lab Isolate" /LENGTH=145 /DNA_ID=CAMNT_0023416031 /DNA_START=47 /DNA_END=484 /DNA_ORIENTATION=-
MLSKFTVLAALAGSAAAFNAPMMNMDTTRRQAIQIGFAGAAGAAISLRPQEADASFPPLRPVSAPEITIFDHRGCANHNNVEYKGPKAGDQDDEMLVKVEMTRVGQSDALAAKFLQENIGYQSKGIDGPYYGQGKSVGNGKGDGK